MAWKRTKTLGADLSCEANDETQSVEAIREIDRQVRRQSSGDHKANEEVILRALRSGRVEAFELFFKTYRDDVYDLAARLTADREEAKDITQEVFLAAWRQATQLAEISRLKPWLFRVTANTCFDHLRKRRHHVSTDELEDGWPPALGDGYQQAELAVMVEETLRRLGDRQRTVLILKDLHGLRLEEIATVLGISESAAHALLHRARVAFRRTYARIPPLATSTPPCALARDIALRLVGRELSPLEKRKLVEHARKCPACRRTLRLQGSPLTGLGVILGRLPWPKGLSPAPTLAPPTSLAPVPSTLSTAAATGGLLWGLNPLAAVKAALLTALAAVLLSAGGHTLNRHLFGPHARPPLAGVAAQPALAHKDTQVLSSLSGEDLVASGNLSAAQPNDGRNIPVKSSDTQTGWDDHQEGDQAAQSGEVDSQSTEDLAGDQDEREGSSLTTGDTDYQTTPRRVGRQASDDLAGQAASTVSSGETDAQTSDVDSVTGSAPGSSSDQANDTSDS